VAWGSLPTEIAKAVGARVIAAASTEGKLAMLRRTVPTPSSDMHAGPLAMADQKELASAFKKATDGRGFEVIADLVGRRLRRTRDANACVEGPLPVPSGFRRGSRRSRCT
jgi:NADPH:quinone reductase-like Zn-dependent oxidoreductase